MLPINGFLSLLHAETKRVILTLCEWILWPSFVSLYFGGTRFSVNSEHFSSLIISSIAVENGMILGVVIIFRLVLNGLAKDGLTEEQNIEYFSERCVCETLMPPIMANSKDSQNQKNNIWKSIERSFYKKWSYAIRKL